MAEVGLEEIFQKIETHQDEFVESLRKWVAIPSVSAVVEGREHCFKMVDYVAEELRSLGATLEICKNPKGKQMFENNVELEYPPIILGEYIDRLFENNVLQ